MRILSKFTFMFMIVSMSCLSFGASRSFNEEQTKFLDALRAIQGTNSEEALVAIDYLAEFKNSETAKITLELLNIELGGNKNPQKIIALLDTIGLVGNRKTVFGDRRRNSNELSLEKFKYRFKTTAGTIEKLSRKSPEINGKIQSIITKLKKHTQSGWPHLFKFKEEGERLNVELANEWNKEIELDREEAKRLEAEYLINNPQSKFSNYKFFKKHLEQQTGGSHLKKEIKAGDSTPAEILLAGTSDFVTDEIVKALSEDSFVEILGREKELNELVTVLIRYKQQNAILIGSKGSGKTSIVSAFGAALVRGNYDANSVTSFLKDSIVVQTSSARVSRLAKSDKPSGQADAIEAYFRALKDIQETTKRRIVVFIDEIHNLSPEQVEAIKPYIESSSSQILLLGASTSREFQNSFKQNDAFKRRLELIAVDDFTDEEILKIFKNSWMKLLTERHPGLKISDKVKMLMIKKVGLIYPDKGALDGTFILADHLAGLLRFQNKGKTVNITEKKLYDFLAEKTGLPVDTRNFAKMEAYRQNLLTEMNKEVLGQEKMLEDVVELWMSVLRNEGTRGIRVGMLMGRSGTGKTETIKQLAQNAFGSKSKVFIIKANQFSDANDIKMSTLVGVPGGVEFGKHTGGRLMDWLDDPAGGKHTGIIVIDEVEKANLLFFETFMELFEEGYIEGGDGKIRRLNSHLIVMTSNMGDKEIFPNEVSEWTDKMVKERLSSWSEEKLRTLFEQFLPDSIVNRVDMVTTSSVILRGVAELIVKKIFDRYKLEYLERSGVVLNISEDFYSEFLEAYDPMKRGARNLVRGIDMYLKGAIEKGLGINQFSAGNTLYLKPVVVEGEKMIEVEFNGNKKHFNMPRLGSSASCKAVMN